MHSSVSPSDAPAAEKAWREVEAGLDELDALVRECPPPETFWPRFLERLSGLTGAAGGLIARLAPHGDWVVLASHGPPEDDRARVSRARGDGPAIQIQAAEPENGESPRTLIEILCGEETTRTLLQLTQPGSPRPSVLQGYRQIADAVRDLAEDYLRRQTVRSVQDRERTQVALWEYVRRLQNARGTEEAAFAAANEARRVIDCDRTLVILYPRGAARTAAVSGVDEFDRRSATLRAAEAFARTAAPYHEPLWSSESRDQLPPQLAAAWEAYVDETHVAHFGLLPLNEQEEAAPTAMLLCEWFERSPTEDQVCLAQDLVALSGPAFARAAEDDALPLRMIARALARRRRDGGGRFLVALLVLAGIVAALVFIPADFTIEAPGRLRPTIQQHVFAPSDGTVLDPPPPSDARVKKGDRLLRLHNPDLDLRRQELAGKQLTVREELAAAETAALRDNDPTEPRGAGNSFHARVEQLKQEAAGLERQAAVLQRQFAQLEVTSPLDGVVLTWDLGRRLTDRPVNRGEILLTVADPSGPWELDLDIPEQDAGHVLVAAKDREVSFTSATSPGRTFHARLAQVAPAAQLTDDGRPAVHGTARELDDLTDADRRAGAAVVAHIHCGRRSLGYVWGRRLWEMLAERLPW